MRWREPRDGDTRVRRGFLLFPKTISGETRWLEWARWQERYEASYESWWMAVAWVDGDRRRD